ncbi:hypothetical protein O3M35_007663 [Rhynocoris fuscipes]|uniref:BTB domain-containing protein n=1 Tax=Rhynocoris fuscipes TaxID=488301 RepID=A0AAW1DCV4_9HEMI
MATTSKDTPQQFCVRWNSYQSNLQSAFPKLLTNEHFVDVTLACESRMVKCHKVVLSACSAYFEKLLVQNPCQHPIIFMKDMKYWEVQALVDFMYKGEVNVTQDELASLLKAAEALEVRGLCGQGEPGAQKLTIPRITDSSSDASKKRKTEGETNEVNLNSSINSSCNNNNSNNNNSNINNNNNNNNQLPTSTVNTTELPRNDHSLPSTPISSSIKNETSLADNGLFEDLDDDFYQDDNSLQIDETGSAYSLSGAGPSVQLDSSPEGSNWNLNNGYPNVILTETLSSSNFSTPSPNNNETPGKIQRIRRSDAELLSAADSICKGMTFQKASQMFNIPMSTIRFYMARKGMLPSRRRGRRISQGMESSPGQSGVVMGGGGGGMGGGGNSVSMGGGGQQQQPQQMTSPQPQQQHHSSPLSYSPMSNLQLPYFKPEPSGY